MRSNLKLILLVVAVLSTVAVLAGYMWERPISLHVAPVENNVPIQVFGLGTVEAQTVSKVGFEAAGTLVELHADHGDAVEAGTLLARLQSRDQEARVAQARAGVVQAEAAIEQASANVRRAEAILKEKTLTNERRQELVGRGTVSQQTADEAQAEADVAKADVAQAGSAVGVARANLQQARAALALEDSRLAKYSLFAPYDAIVMTRHRELGSALNANEPVFTLVDPQTIWGLAYIDEARAGRIEIGQPAEVIRRSAPEQRIPAKVVRIDIESDRVNEEYRVYVRCGGCPRALHIGEQVEVVITVARLPSARLVKLNALTKVGGREATAWTVEDGKLQQRRVTLGQRTLDGRVEITGGVPDRAELVAAATAGLSVDRRVTIASGEKPK